MRSLDVFDGHLILYCKDKYKISRNDFVLGLKRIWAVRCGFDGELPDRDLYVIANHMRELAIKLQPEKESFIHEIVHMNLSKIDKSKNPIEEVIQVYADSIRWTSVKEKRTKNFVQIIKLPRPQKRIFNRILSGRARGMQDYNSITKAA